MTHVKGIFMVASVFCGKSCFCHISFYATFYFCILTHFLTKQTFSISVASPTKYFTNPFIFVFFLFFKKYHSLYKNKTERIVSQMTISTDVSKPFCCKKSYINSISGVMSLEGNENEESIIRKTRQEIPRNGSSVVSSILSYF